MLDGIPDVDQRRNATSARATGTTTTTSGARASSVAGKRRTGWSRPARSRTTADQGAGDIDFVDCEQAAGTVNACTHDLRYVNINVPGKKDMTIDDYQLKLVGRGSTSAWPSSTACSYQDQQRQQIEDVDGGTRPPAEWSSIGEPQTPEAAETGYYPIWDESWKTRHSAYQHDDARAAVQVDRREPPAIRRGPLLPAREQADPLRHGDAQQQELLRGSGACRSDSIPTACPTAGCSTRAKRTTTSKAAFAQFDYRIVDKA